MLDSRFRRNDGADMITVSAEPTAFSFEPKHTALLMIDMQRDFIEPGGFGATLGNDVSLLAPVVPAAAALIAWCRQHGVLVIHTQECHEPDLSDCPPAKRLRGKPSLRIGDPGSMGRILIKGEAGAGFVPELLPQDGDVVIAKPGKGAFYGTPLTEVLQSRGITHLIFGGVTTEVCVQTTMREANDRGYECLIVEEATGSYFPAFKESALAMIRAQGGIVGWTTHLADLPLPR
jgi:nicotinamidase-related amidase